LTLCRLLSAQRKEPEALRLLELLKPQTEREGNWMGQAEISLLQAVLLDRMGRREQAMNALREALTIGETNAYIRTFLDEEEQTEKLLRKYTFWISEKESSEEDAGVAAGLKTYAEELLARFMGKAFEEIAATTEQPALVEPLTRTEIRLLDLIRQGESNKRIAEKMSLSEGSVKVYSSRLYGKLGVSSRTQAVVAAQRLGLLQDD